MGKGLASINMLTYDLGHLTQARALLLTQLARCSILLTSPSQDSFNPQFRHF